MSASGYTLWQFSSEPTVSTMTSKGPIWSEVVEPSSRTTLTPRSVSAWAWRSRASAVTWQPRECADRLDLIRAATGVTDAVIACRALDSTVTAAARLTLRLEEHVRCRCQAERSRLSDPDSGRFKPDGRAPAALRSSAVSGWGPLSAQSSGDQPAPWSSRRVGSAPCASSSRTVAVCPQHAAAHSGVPSEPGPLLSVSGEAPASMSKRASSASPCTDARYRGVVPSVFLLSGLAPLRSSVCTRLASPARIAPKRRWESFFWCRCFIAGEVSDHGYVRTTHNPFVGHCDQRSGLVADARACRNA